MPDDQSECREVLPGFVGPFRTDLCNPTHSFVIDSTDKWVGDAIPNDAAVALARILNSHGAVVEALKKIEGGCFDTPEGDEEAFVVAHQKCASEALKLTTPEPEPKEMHR